MTPRFTPLEARIIGSLIEKEITTPDQYPLSLNALLAACNQKSNRDPEMALAERELQAALDGLQRRHLVVEKSGFGSRVPKYQHRFCNTEFGTLKFDPQELAIVCELLLRGPQTPGELRGRAARMAAFADAAATEAVLERLATRTDGPWVQRLAREPGRREARYAGTLVPDAAAAAAPASQESAGHAPQAVTRAVASGGSATDDDVQPYLTALERRLEELEARIAQLEAAQLPTPHRES